MARIKVKTSYPTCENDGFPMLKIHGNLHCVGEYLDRCIGGKEVVDLIRRGKTTYYVFEDGHELPMLCFCCGNPLLHQSLAQARRQMCGRRLESMSFSVGKVASGREVIEFKLEFSKKGWLSLKTDRVVAPEVAARLRHPTSCQHKKQPATHKASHKKKLRRKK